MDPNEIRTSPEEQRAEGLTPDEQRQQREEESQAADQTKYEQLRELETEERDDLADRVNEAD